MKTLIKFVLFSLFFYKSFGQLSTNTVRYQVTYSADIKKYTVWVVPNYNTPNANNADTTEKGATAQVSLRVPKDFVISDIKGIKGEWENNPLRLGPNEPNQSLFNSLNPAYRYYAIGKSIGETNYGRFTKDKPVALFTFQGNGCFGAISLMDDSDEFVKIANDSYSLNVKPSFYSKSGQKPLINATPLEQFTDPLEPAAFCCGSSGVSFGGAITFADDKKDICVGNKLSLSLKNIKGVTNQNIKFVLSSTEPINETEAYSPNLQLLGTVSNTSLTNNKSEASLSNITLPSTLGRYFVVAIIDDGLGANGCKSYTSARISVNAPPTPKIVADRSGFVCKGDVVTMKATPVNQSKYEWILENTVVFGVDTDSYSTTVGGNYSVRVTNAAGCVGQSASFSFSTIVVSQPIIKQQGEKLVSSAKRDNQWYFNNNIIAGATDTVFLPKTQGSYQVQTIMSGCKSLLSPAVLWAITGLLPKKTDSLSAELYPNPSKGVFIITLPNDVKNEWVSVKIISVKGQIVKSIYTQLIDNRLEINEKLSLGHYFVQINTTQRKFTKKLKIE